MAEIFYSRKHDIEDLAAIDNKVFGSLDCWRPVDFETAYRERNVICLTLVDDASEIRGYVVYRVFRTRYDILRFAVESPARRKGYGRLLIDKVRSKLSVAHRRVCVIVSERDLEAQRFLRHLGFRGVSVLPGYFHGRDGYRFVYRYRLPHEPAGNAGPEDLRPPFHAKDR